MPYCCKAFLLAANYPCPLAVVGPTYNNCFDTVSAAYDFNFKFYTSEIKQIIKLFYDLHFPFTGIYLSVQVMASNKHKLQKIKFKIAKAFALYERCAQWRQCRLKKMSANYCGILCILFLLQQNSNAVIPAKINWSYNLLKHPIAVFFY